MRTLFLLLCALCLPLVGVTAPADEEPEIVIEIIGEPDSAPKGVAVLQTSVKDLEKTFKKATRDTVLRTANIISRVDSSLTAADGKKYRYVRYGYNNDEYRKFLFDANDYFLACTDNVIGTLSLNKKYRLNMEVDENDFLRTFPEAVLTNLIDFTSSQDLQAYQVTLPEEKKPSYFIFNNEFLVQAFDNESEYTNYVTQLSVRNQQWLETEHEKQQKQLEQLRHEQEEAIRKAREERHRWKALLRGGTIEDRMYMPIVVHSDGPLLPTPVADPTRAGTPIFVH